MHTHGHRKRTDDDGPKEPTDERHPSHGVISNMPREESSESPPAQNHDDQTQAADEQCHVFLQKERIQILRDLAKKINQKTAGALPDGMSLFCELSHKRLF